MSGQFQLVIFYLSLSFGEEEQKKAESENLNFFSFPAKNCELGS